MKQFFTLLCLVMLGITTASADTTVTYNGRQLSNGEELTFTVNDMEVAVPGVIWQIGLKFDANVSGKVKCTAVTNETNFQFCTTSCWSKVKQDDGTLKATCDLTPGSNLIDIHYDYFGEGEGVKYMTVTVDPEGTPFVFTVKCDLTAGIGNVVADSDSSFDVYSISGVRVLSNGTADEVKTLPAGIYIVNGHKLVVR